MMYVENNSMDPYFCFALEYYLLKEIDLERDFFLFWRTTPAIMIGKHQNTLVEINQDYVKEKHIQVVRRITGGGTIYTDPDTWQFSFIIKNKSYNDINFETYIDPIIKAFFELGINSDFSSRNDILIKGKKVSGNAQYIDSQCNLHHGSILFDTNLDELVKALTVSEEKIISKGIKSVRERVTTITEHLNEKIDILAFKELMLHYLLQNIDGTYELTPKDIKRVNEIADGNFRQWEWNYGKSPKFNIIKSNRFEGGKVEFNIYVNKGIIEQCKIYGDFFSQGDIEIVSYSLIGCLYKEENIRVALEDICAENFFYLISNEDLIRCII
ncbi:Lipoate-protein ligase LplJ [Sporomusa silvacetica DSM 10669]|uniref:lipoate--protein ligase n=1 Tax=Sporomusa silvacetica DSM 10669 TaxID=1123289 RepID=A0ABZ3ILG6_9FIRM|nr:lipoate--protein ligase [Sporomusa silvacetica]OZC13431.1 lipoate-protein ligase LplJ [Sporomusa silvacetica DSM 10669]